MYDKRPVMPPYQSTENLKGWIGEVLPQVPGLVDQLLSQGYGALSLEKSFKKFYGRYQDVIEKYQRSVNVMVNDSFPG